MKIFNFEQGSPEWFAIRIGKVTMSRADDFTKKGRGNKPSVTVQNYVNDLVSERLSGRPVEIPQSYAMERGSFMERYAFEAIEKATKLKFHTCGFVQADDERIGYSPDGMATNENALLEIKSPMPRKHIQNIKDDLSSYRKQCQGGMWVTGREFCYLASWCPDVRDFPLYVRRITRSETAIEEISAAAVSVADQVDELVNELVGMTRPDIDDIAARALNDWENVFSDGDVKL